MLTSPLMVSLADIQQRPSRGCMTLCDGRGVPGGGAVPYREPCYPCHTHCLIPFAQPPFKPCICQRLGLLPPQLATDSDYSRAIWAREPLKSRLMKRGPCALNQLHLLLLFSKIILKYLNSRGGIKIDPDTEKSHC